MSKIYRMNTDMSHDCLFKAVECMTLEQAYETKRLSAKQILTEWGFYITTNALGVYLMLLCMVMSVAIIYDCATDTGIIMGILNAFTQYPVPIWAILIAAFCPFVYAMAQNVMKRTVIEFGEV